MASWREAGVMHKRQRFPPASCEALVCKALCNVAGMVHGWRWKPASRRAAHIAMASHRQIQVSALTAAADPAMRAEQGGSPSPVLERPAGLGQALRMGRGHQACQHPRSSPSTLRHSPPHRVSVLSLCGRVVRGSTFLHQCCTTTDDGLRASARPTTNPPAFVPPCLLATPRPFAFSACC